MICGMRRTVQTDIQTKLEIEHASVGLTHARPIMDFFGYLEQAVINEFEFDSSHHLTTDVTHVIM